LSFSKFRLLFSVAFIKNKVSWFSFSKIYHFVKCMSSAFHVKTQLPSVHLILVVYRLACLPCVRQTWLWTKRLYVFVASPLRSKSKDWLARNRNNVSKWSDMSTCGLLFQWASIIKIPTQGLGLEQRGHHHPHIIKV